MTTPRRYKELDELSVDEHVRRRQDPDAKFETPEYRDARRAALEDAGLEHDDPADKAPEEMSVEEHARRIYERK